LVPFRSQRMSNARNRLCHALVRSTTHRRARPRRRRHCLGFSPRRRMWGPDSTCSHLTVDIVEVVALVEAQIRRPTRTARCSHDDRIDRRNGCALVVDVRRGDLGRERHTSAIGEDVTLDARLASVGRVGTCRVAAFRSLDDCAVQRRPLPVDTTHVVIEPDELLEESSEDASLRPCLKSRVTC
jgi:hypothetical protein